MINNAKATLANDFDSNATKLKPFKSNTIVQCEQNNTVTTLLEKQNQTLPLISSIPSRIDQTQEEIIEPVLPAETENITQPEKIIKVKKSKYHKRKKIRKKPIKRVIKRRTVKKPSRASSIDLF